MKRLKPLVLLLLVATAIMLGFTFYKLYVDFPEQARAENLNYKYAQLVDDLNKAIALSNSDESLANELENIKYPADTLAVAMRGKSKRKRTGSSKSKIRKWNKEIIIFDRRKANSDGGANSEFSAMLFGGGHGSKNGQHYWILHHKLRKYGYDVIEVLFERETPETAQ